MDITALIVSAGIPSTIIGGIVGLFFWRFQRNIEKREAAEKEERIKRQNEVDRREEVREQSQHCLLRSVQASLALGEATARAVQRIPDAHCNGDMHKALEYAEQVKHEQKDFLQTQAIKHIY